MFVVYKPNVVIFVLKPQFEAIAFKCHTHAFIFLHGSFLFILYNNVLVCRAWLRVIPVFIGNALSHAHTGFLLFLNSRTKHEHELAFS